MTAAAGTWMRELYGELWATVGDPPAGTMAAAPIGILRATR